MVKIDSIIAVFIDTIGGNDIFYGLFSFLFIVAVIYSFYKITT